MQNPKVIISFLVEVKPLEDKREFSLEQRPKERVLDLGLSKIHRTLLDQGISLEQSKQEGQSTVNTSETQLVFRGC